MYVPSTKSNKPGESQARDTQREKNALAREIIIQETDLRKIKQERNSMETEFRRLKKDVERIETTMRDTQSRLKKTDEEIRQAEGFVHGLKKKLNLL